jgi:hypothetical protein
MSTDYNYDEQVEIFASNRYFSSFLADTYHLLGAIFPVLHPDSHRPRHPPSHIQPSQTEQG